MTTLPTSTGSATPERLEPVGVAVPAGDPATVAIDTTAASGPITGRRSGDPARPIGRYIVVVLTGLVGLFVSFGMFAAITRWQDHLAELRFTSLASDHLQTINVGLKDATDLLYSMRAYCESLDHPVTRTEFQAFSRSLRQRVVGLRDTGWAPRVTRAQREAFEQAIRSDGLPDFQIVERTANDKLVHAGDRDEYFPILYSDPGEINRPIMGFDLNSEPLRNRAIRRARLTERPAATPPVKLMNMQRPNGGLMSFIPVDATPAPNGEVPPVAGVVLGAFETAAMIENIMATKLRLTGLDMYVFDPDEPQDKRLIYWHSTKGRAVPDEGAVFTVRHWQGTLELLDQRWGVVFIPSGALDGSGANGEIADPLALAVLAGGLSMTGLIVGYLWFSMRRTQHLERLTNDLRKTTDELRQNGAKLDHLARHDALTCLPNRTGFRDAVSAVLQLDNPGHSLALLYLDLDRFKAVNDTLGHPAGDQLLCLVADRLRSTVRETDIITRLGGDEFAIAQTLADQPLAAETLGRRIIDALSRPYNVAGQLVVVGVSIGIALAHRSEQDVDHLLRRADMALYAAKRNGRGTWHFFEPAMEYEAKARRGLEMELRHALEHGEFELYYQPQINVADGCIRGFEALLRWHHPERGLVMPGDFIRCAEETGLILPIGAWVLHNALREAASWPSDIRVAINLSPYQLARDDLVELVAAALALFEQNGGRLELEVNENALIQYHAEGHESLQQLRSLGIRIAMDGFGTGHASLSHLRNFPFDRIKIDQSFVAGMTESPEGAAIVCAILQLATSLNIATTAEGVETPNHLKLLTNMGCREAQGFLFGAPRPASEIVRMLMDVPGFSHAGV